MQNQLTSLKDHRDAYADLTYRRLTDHLDVCAECHRAANAMDPDEMCAPGRYAFHEWARAERRAT